MSLAYEAALREHTTQRENYKIYAFLVVQTKGSRKDTHKHTRLHPHFRSLYLRQHTPPPPTNIPSIPPNNIRPVTQILLVKPHQAHLLHSGYKRIHEIILTFPHVPPVFANLPRLRHELVSLYEPRRLIRRGLGVV